MKKNRRAVWLLGALSMACFVSAAYAKKARSPGHIYTSSFNQEWLKAVVSIEKIDWKESPVPVGTGFLMLSAGNHCLLVTAKHVVLAEGNRPRPNLAYRFNNIAHHSILLTEDALKKKGLGEWFVSSNADVACRFIGVKSTFDFKVIGVSHVLPQSGVQAGAPVVILGFPLGLRSEKYAVPMVRRGMVALSEGNRLIVDGFIFPGNSGGPVVYVPAVDFSGGPLLNQQRLIGLISSYIPYEDVAISAQTRHPRILFEENSGMCDVVPADAIEELINRSDVQAFNKTIKD